MNTELAEKIQSRAYLLWERENRPEGKHLEHWHCATAEIEAERSSVTGQSDRPSSGQSTPTAAVTNEVAPKVKGRSKRKIG